MRSSYEKMTMILSQKPELIRLEDHELLHIRQLIGEQEAKT